MTRYEQLICWSNNSLLKGIEAKNKGWKEYPWIFWKTSEDLKEKANALILSEACKVVK